MKRYTESELHEEKSGIASPDGAISFLLCIFAIINGYSNTFTIPNASIYSIGAVQVLLSLAAFTASLLNIIRGKARGNINMMATLLLGFFPGLNRIITVTAQNLGYGFNGYMFGVVYLIGSIFTLGVAFKRVHKPAYRFVGTLCLAFGFLLQGLGLLEGSLQLIKLSGWLFFVFALEMYYFGLTVMYFYYDYRLPQGKSILGERKKKKHGKD